MTEKDSYVPKVLVLMPNVLVVTYGVVKEQQGILLLAFLFTGSPSVRNIKCGGSRNIIYFYFRSPIV